MIQYLVILLDDTSTSYCHYTNEKEECRLIKIEDLKAGILFAMKENLMIQLVYPFYELPLEYKDLIDTISCCKIQPIAYADDDVDIVIFDEWNIFNEYTFHSEIAYIFRTNKDDFFNKYDILLKAFDKITRLNIVITDVDTFNEKDFDEYKLVLKKLTDGVSVEYQKGKSPQLNLLTDRMVLDEMNNCNAGWKNITLAPDGKFYVCPAFYQSEESYCIGTLSEGLNIKNPQLYKLNYAPLCSCCDAYQCKRCIWLNRKTTMEVNIPSHEQCVSAHLERNASRNLLSAIRALGTFLPDKDIKEINYLDPFDVKNEY